MSKYLDYNGLSYLHGKLSDIFVPTDDEYLDALPESTSLDPAIITVTNTDNGYVCLYPSPLPVTTSWKLSWPGILQPQDITSVSQVQITAGYMEQSYISINNFTIVIMRLSVGSDNDLFYQYGSSYQTGGTPQGSGTLEGTGTFYIPEFGAGGNLESVQADAATVAGFTITSEEFPGFSGNTFIAPAGKASYVSKPDGIGLKPYTGTNLLVSGGIISPPNMLFFGSELTVYRREL